MFVAVHKRGREGRIKPRHRLHRAARLPGRTDEPEVEPAGIRKLLVRTTSFEERVEWRRLDRPERASKLSRYDLPASSEHQEEIVRTRVVEDRARINRLLLIDHPECDHFAPRRLRR